MIRRTLEKIEEMIGGSNLKKEEKNIVINGVSTDSRSIKPNQLFVPIKGERFNGHNFIKDAIKGGATATLWNENEPIPNDLNIPFILVEDTLVAIQNLAKSYRQQLNTKIVGITGSNGKTSTKDILASILNTKYKTQKTIGNLNNHLGVPLTILNLKEDTEIAVVEMGMSNIGEIELLSSIASPDVAIVTNIGKAHLQDLGSIENVAKAKFEIINHLNPNGLFICFGDNPILKNKIEKLNSTFKTVTFGKKKYNTYHFELISINENRLLFKLNTFNSQIFNLPMLGKHQIQNATAAIIVAKYFNIPFENIQEGFSKVEMTGMRNELIHTKTCTILNDSYNANPASVSAALETLYSLKDYNKKIVVLGDMLELGKDEVSIHEEIGKEISPNQIDYLLTFGSLAKNIAKGASSIFPKNRISSYMNKNDLINDLKNIINNKTIVLVKGSRSLHLEEIVEALKII